MSHKSYERRNQCLLLTSWSKQGRKKGTYKSTSPAMQNGLNTLKNKETDLQLSPEERRLHRRENCDPQEAQLRTA